MAVSRRWRTSCARLDEARLADVVLELLAPHGVADDLLELAIVGALAQRGAQVGLVQREQARAQAAVGGQPDPVAVAAERLRDRIDEADPALAVGEAVHPGGRVRLARLGLQRIHGVDRSPDLGAGQHLLRRPGMVGVERHELDEADLVRSAARELGEREHLLLGEAADRDGVDLDRMGLGEGRQQLEPRRTWGRHRGG